MPDTFYSAFENRFRGSRELILMRLQVYLDYILPLKDIYTDLPALDLGCGRGEWLEITSAQGFSVHGVDIDEGMLGYCHERNLSCNNQDASEYITALPDESQVIVSAFHLIEHLSFDKVLKLVEQSLRVLKPCGLLILETPNPENFLVSTHNFYLDPSHIKPIPPELLAFAGEYSGFRRINILRLLGNQNLLNQNLITAYEVITGVGGDYSVIAQKDGNDEDLSRFDVAYSKKHGFTLHDISCAYRERIEMYYQQIESQGQQLAELRQLIKLTRLIKKIVKAPLELIRWVLRKPQ